MATVQQVTAQATRALVAAEPDLAHAMSQALSLGIVELDDNRALLDLLDASVEGNVTTILHMLTNDIPVEHLQPTTAAVEYALRLAQQGVPASALMRAYHMGQEYFRDRISAQVQDLPHPPELKLQTIVHVSTLLYRYIDWITQYVLAEYEQERTRWVSARGTVRSSQVHAVLARHPVDHHTFAVDTGYRLDQHHLAAVVWTSTSVSGQDEQRTLELAVRTIATLAGATAAPLFTAVDRSTAWSWIPLGAGSRRPDVGQLRDWAARQPDLHVCLGLPLEGEHGFRRSHEQAQESRGVALAVPDRPVAAVTGYDDPGVAITALLARNLEATRTWVSEVLGELARDDDGAALLRETMRIFFLTGESYQRTSELLVVHRNTVKYRVAKVLDDRRSSLEHDRLDLALALQACHLLGPAVLLR